MTGNARYLQIIEDSFGDRFTEGGTTKNINTMSVFLTPAYVYEKTRNVTYLPWLLVQTGKLLGRPEYIEEAKR